MNKLLNKQELYEELLKPTKKKKKVYYRYIVAKGQYNGRWYAIDTYDGSIMMSSDSELGLTAQMLKRGYKPIVT